MDGSLKDVTSKAWGSRLIGAFIVQQFFFILSFTVFGGGVVRPSSQFRPHGMTEADKELYSATVTSEDLGFNLDSLIQPLMAIIALAFVAYAVFYLLSWKRMDRHERRAALVTIAVYCVIYAAVVLYFRNYTGVFRMYMNLIPTEISALLSLSLYLIQKKFRRPVPGAAE